MSLITLLRTPVAVSTLCPKQLPQLLLAAKGQPHPPAYRTKHQQKAKDPEWTTIYRLPLIRWAAAFNRLKIYQGILTVAGTPLTIAFEQSGALSANMATVVAAVGISGLATLALASLAVRNTVGFVYVNEAADKVKLAYVDYWGRRQQKIVNSSDIVPVEDWQQSIPGGPVSFYQKIRIEGEGEKLTFKLMPRFAIIEEPETFMGLFGE